MVKHQISFAVKYPTAQFTSAFDVVIKLYELSDKLHFHITELRSSNKYEGIQIDMEYKCQMARAQTIIQDIIKAMGSQTYDWGIYE